MDGVPPTGSGRSSSTARNRAAQAANGQVEMFPRLTWIKAIVRLPPNDWRIAFEPRRVFNIEVACVPERNLVFVVDDDAMMLKSVA